MSAAAEPRPHDGPARIGSHERWLAAGFLAVIAATAAVCGSFGTPPEAARLLPCPLRLCTGLPCPGCGITRASVALVSGQPLAAWRLHPGAWILVPLALATLIAPGRLRRAFGALPRAARIGLPGVAIGLLLARWAMALADG